MPAPIYSAADYQQSLANLAPTGRAWPRDPGSTLMGIFGALSPSYARNSASALALLEDVVPTQTLNLLPEWEASLGLPETYAPVGQTVAQRQSAVSAKWAARGGQSQAYFTHLAATLGVAITITQFAPARVGVLRVGQPLYGVAWAHTWQINMPTFVVQPFRVAENSVGDALNTWGTTYVQQRLMAASPAHTNLIFNYT